MSTPKAKKEHVKPIPEEEPKKKKTRLEEALEKLGPATIRKIKESGMQTLEDVALSSRIELEGLTGIGDILALKIQKKAQEALGLKVRTGKEIKAKYAKRLKITLPCDTVNSLLGGGLETGCITEFAGQFRSGKTQLAHQYAVCATLPPKKGGLRKNILWIDTESTFRPGRIEAMAEDLSLDPDEVLESIHVGRAYNVDLQENYTRDVLNDSEKYDIGLVIVDSLTANFRAEYVGRGTLAIRQQRLGKYMHLLANQADSKNIAVLITNQVLSKPDMMFGDPNIPVGGNVVAHTSVHRIILRKKKGQTRSATILDSPELPEIGVDFLITEVGIRDPSYKPLKTK